jgi:predicted anti-sigma-YlaC factor YlaD
MNHKQYEKWILDDSHLNKGERKLLDTHLATCADCRKLKNGWQNSLQVIRSTEQHIPTPGFTARWQIKLQQDQKRRMIVRRRVIVFSSLLFVLISMAAYIILSGSFSAFLANLITLSTQIILFLTKGLSDLTLFINEVPSVVRWSVGIFLVGVANMFVILLVMLLWKARKNHREWQGAQVYAEE